MTPNRIVEIFDAEQSTAVYPDVAAFRADVVAIQREMIAQLIRAGCEYIHIDAPGYASYVDDTTLARLRERGEDPDARLEQDIATDNAVIDGFDNITFALHVCRGNFKGRWGRQGGYDNIAERLFAGLNHHRLLLEYDSPRAGSFDSLRFVPADKIAVLGLISTKLPELESADELKRRIEEASQFLAIDQLAISSQCGFSTMLEGHPLTVEQQWAKLERMLEVADEVWS
jgi:5-methyltetrahydropteroyltriglutamate--homocysteine methyltransferase